MPPPPLLILDYRVLVWDLTGKLARVDPMELETYLRAAWLVVLNQGSSVINPQDLTVVVVDDNQMSRPYWRREYLKSCGIAQEYKGGRKAKTESWHLVCSTGINLIKEKGFHYLTLPGFEADDLAGSLVSAHHEHGLDRTVYLSTIDTDWHQLVSDKVHWLNTAKYAPRFRGPSEVLEHAKKSLNMVIDTPRQLVAAKAIKGDKSDNLPPGSPPEVIDLISPPEAYNLRHYPVYETIKAIVKDPDPNNDLGILSAATRWIVSRGYPWPLI